VEEREREVAAREKKMREGEGWARAWGEGRARGSGQVRPRTGLDRGPAKNPLLALISNRN
jgi:hypothetical protein